MSVEDNIASVLELTGKPIEYQKEKLESLIAEFRLQKVRKNLGDQLSGGERRRTEIARCLAIDPKFINGNAIAVFTAIGMCWSGFLSTHTAMLDALGYRRLTSKDIFSHTIGGLFAGISAHWLYVLVSLIIA